MRAKDNYLSGTLSADTAAFVLAGGLYGIDYLGTWNSGTFTLQRLGGDGSTYVTAATAFSANGYTSVNLAAGTYKLVKSGSPSGIYISLTRIPGE